MKAAAFYDVDGTLVSTNVVHTYAWYAVNVPSLTDKVKRTGSLLASLPFYMVADKVGRKFFNDIFYKNYAGMGEDRLNVLGEELFDRWIRGKMYPDMVDLIRRSKAEGYQQVIVTGALDVMVRPMARFLGIDDWAANRLEIVDGRATGRLVPPIFAGPEKAAFVRRYAIEHDLDLNECRAYADSGSDTPMLAMVGRPCAVNPDMSLASTARAHDWPIIRTQSKD